MNHVFMKHDKNDTRNRKRNWKYYKDFTLNEKQYSITESGQRLFKEVYFEQGFPGG